jgi:outer membrane protein
MARIALAGPSSCAAAARPLSRGLRAVILLPLISGCASHPAAAPIPAEVSRPGVAARVLVPPDLNVNPKETVVRPDAFGRASAEPTAIPAPADGPMIFALPDAISFALQYNPRLRSARAAIERAQGQEQVAFAPFLPQIDLLGQYGVVSRTLAPGSPGYAGFLLPGDFDTRSYAETEIGLQWTLYDFGRTGGHYQQAVGRERITQLQLARARQTVEFDVSAAYMDVLLARASRRVQEDAVRRAEAILEDTEARRKGGVALKEDVLRAEVQLSESREALVLSREGEFNAVARLNNAMGRNAGLPLEVVDVEAEPPLPGALASLLELAADQRPEVSLARQAVAVAQAGQQAAEGEFLPRIFIRTSAGRTDGENVITGWQEGAGLHVESPLYAGGRHRGELRSADADIEAALADAQVILDAISLQVNVAYRGVIASRERIELARTAIIQAEENLRLLQVRYRNGNATPTDIVDSEAALTRSQQRFFSATYTYLAALDRLEYALGRQGAFLRQAAEANRKQQPAPEEVPVPLKLPAIK